MEKTILTAFEQEWYDTVRSCSRGDITNREASYRLGLKIRQVQRLKRACEKDGEKGIVHGLKGTTAHNRVDEKPLSSLLVPRRGVEPPRPCEH